MVKTLHFHHRGCRFNPCLGNYDHTCSAAKNTEMKQKNLNGPLTITETESVFNILPMNKTKEPNGFKVSATKYSKCKEFQS